MNVRAELTRAQHQAPHVPTDLDGLRRLRDRRASNGRIGTAMLALVIGFGAIGGAVWAFRGESGGTRVGEGAHVGPASSDLTLGEGDYYYMRVVASYPLAALPATGGSEGISTDDRQASYETWWAADGSGRVHNLRGSDMNEGDFGPGGFRSDTGDVSDLSTDPAQLEAQLRIRVQPNGASPEPYEGWGGPIEWGLIRSIQELLLSPDLLPAQKAALVEVAANLDGVVVDDRVVDPSGRRAILLSTHTEDKVSEWWFDPASHQLLTTRETYDDNGAQVTHTVAAAGVARSTDSDHLMTEFIPATG
ncbi:MAG: hypothetical protein H0W82_01125 [Actinobacteria bacterium]|nr:hypothetical protein [Actinomycetota bacterium]